MKCKGLALAGDTRAVHVHSCLRHLLQCDDNDIFFALDGCNKGMVPALADIDLYGTKETGPGLVCAGSSPSCDLWDRL